MHSIDSIFLTRMHLFEVFDACSIEYAPGAEESSFVTVTAAISEHLY